jgi:hypothetical protein
MSAFQIFALISALLNLTMAIMMSSSTGFGVLLKVVFSAMAVFATLICLALFGFVLAPGVRLV